MFRLSALGMHDTCVHEAGGGERRDSSQTYLYVVIQRLQLQRKQRKRATDDCLSNQREAAVV